MGQLETGRLRITEAARLVGTSPSRLRQWEREGLLRPSRGRGGQRLYRPDDVDRAREVALLRAEQLNAPAIRRILGMSPGTPAASTKSCASSAVGSFERSSMRMAGPPSSTTRR